MRCPEHPRLFASGAAWLIASALAIACAEQTSRPAPRAELVLGVQRRVVGAEGERVVRETLRAPLSEVAFVTQHLWNVGEPDGPAIPTRFHVGMGTEANTHRAAAINAAHIRPALEAARRAGLLVVHSQPGFIAHKWPQYKALISEMQGVPLQAPLETPATRAYTPEETASWTVQTWPGWAYMNFPTPLKPHAHEPVTMTSEELDFVLKKHGIRTLIYVGYATDMCLIGYTGGLSDMTRKFGYRACVLRDATLATELGDGRAGPEKTAESLALIEREYAPTASVRDFLNAIDSPSAALQGRTELKPGESNVYFIIDRQRYTWCLRPNTVQYVHDVWAYETNGFGLRDVDFPLEKSAGTKRIVCLGDSVTYGTGVSFDQTYGQQLDRRLRVHDPGVKVINAGIGSQRAWHGLERLDRDVLRFDPDLVIVCFGFNDGVLQPQTLWEEWSRKLAEKSPGEKPAHPVSTRPAPSGPDGLTPSVPIDDYAQHLRDIIRRIRDKSRARVFLLTFTTINDDYHRSDWTPELRQRQRQMYDAYRQRMRDVGLEMDVPVVDVCPRFAESTEVLVLPDGIHPSAQGHRVIAEELYRRIRETPGW